MKRLTLIRHGKSSWKDPSLDDFDRPLNSRGKREVPEMGRRLAQRGTDPDAIVTSPAKRARKTAHGIAGALGWDQDIVEIADIYEASVETLFEVLRDFREEWNHVVLVGHNPGFTDLANSLFGERISNVPTCGVAEGELRVERWSDVAPGTGTLTLFDFPKREPPDS